MPVNPRNGLEENHFVLDFFDCEILIFHSHFESLVSSLKPRLSKLRHYICLDKKLDGYLYFEEWIAQHSKKPIYMDMGEDEIALLPGTGGTTGVPKAVIVNQ